jgi:hypothetical protein
VKHRRRPLLVVAILLYVTLDLSLPTIPGAFEFNVDDSVEGTQSNRSRGPAEVVVVPRPARISFVVQEPRVTTGDWRIAASEAATLRPSVLEWFPRRLPEPAPSSEDPD